MSVDDACEVGKSIPHLKVCLFGAAEKLRWGFTDFEISSFLDPTLQILSPTASVHRENLPTVTMAPALLFAQGLKFLIQGGLRLGTPL